VFARVSKTAGNEPDFTQNAGIGMICGRVRDVFTHISENCPARVR
jgi:hypothetical protein